MVYNYGDSVFSKGELAGIWSQLILKSPPKA